MLAQLLDSLLSRLKAYFNLERLGLLLGGTPHRYHHCCYCSGDILSDVARIEPGAGRAQCRDYEQNSHVLYQFSAFTAGYRRHGGGHGRLGSVADDSALSGAG